MRTILALPSDMQSGGTTAIPAPGDWIGVDGNTYSMSRSQRTIREQWLEGWNEIRSLRDKKTRLIIVSVGEAIEGVHHGSTQMITYNIEEQKSMHIATMLEAMEIAKWNDKTDILYYLNSSNTHTGNTENDIAKQFTTPKGKYLVPPVIKPTAANKFQDGRFVRDILNIDINGVYFSIAHHGLSAGTREWTKENPTYNTMKSFYFTCLNKKRRLPRYVIGGHKHQFVTVEYNGKQGDIRGMLLPSLQFKTRFGHKVARFSEEDIGMVYFVIEEDGRSSYHPSILEDEDEEIEKV